MDLWDFISAVSGPLLRYKATNDVAGRQNEINNQSTAYRGNQAAQGMAATNTLLDYLSPTNRAAQTATAKATLADNLNKTVGVARAYEAGPNFGGKTSAAYTDRFASNNADINNRVARSVDQLSTMGAPALREQGDARAIGNANTIVGATNTAANNVGARYAEAMGTVRPNPFLTFGSQLADGLNLLRSTRKRAAPAIAPAASDYEDGVL